MAETHYLHDGLVFYSRPEYKAHFETCPKCRPDYEAELAAGRAFGERVIAAMRRNGVVLFDDAFAKDARVVERQPSPDGSDALQ